MLFYRLIGNRRAYTLNPEGAEVAAPAKYSVEDKFSAERVALKIKYQIFPFDRAQLGNHCT